jgi:predicted transcriptional regulator
MSDARQPVAKSSTARVLWAVGVLDTPTAKEVSNYLEIRHKRAQDTLRQLFRSNLVARRKRQTNNPGSDPYEYAIRIPEEHE